MFDMTPLDDMANVEWQYLQERDGPVSAVELAGHDALILLGQRFDRSSVPADGRLAHVVCRFREGSNPIVITVYAL